MSWSIDLRANKVGGTWVRRFGPHEEAGIQISLNDISANVTTPTFGGIMFEVDRADVPSLWHKLEVDSYQLYMELIDTLRRRASESESVVQQLIDAFHGKLGDAHQRGLREGRAEVQDQIKTALGL